MIEQTTNSVNIIPSKHCTPQYAFANKVMHKAIFRKMDFMLRQRQAEAWNIESWYQLSAVSVAISPVTKESLRCRHNGCIMYGRRAVTVQLMCDVFLLLLAYEYIPGSWDITALYICLSCAVLFMFRCYIHKAGCMFTYIHIKGFDAHFHREKNIEHMPHPIHMPVYTG